MGSWSFRVPLANLAALLLGWCCWCAAGPAPTGAVYVTTLPSGADVWLDGAYVGRSPVVIDALAIGPHHLTLNRTGWSTEDFPVTVAAAQTQTTSVVLVRQGRILEPGGTIALHGGPDAGTITALDGAPVAPAKDGSIAAPAGTHDVTFSGAQGKATRTVTVYPQTRTDVVLRTDVSERSVVLAPADDYLPSTAYRLEGTRLIVHYKAHTISGRVGERSYLVDGQSSDYDAPPTVIANRIYLPIELLTMLTANDKK